MTTIPAGEYLNDPLLESAPIMFAAAQKHCHPNPLDGRNCFPYHAGWQYLRLLGAVRSAGGHTDFIVDSFRRFAAEGARRVLVSGAADYSMPGHIIQAFAEAGAPLELVVIDHCETPLAITRWLADYYGVKGVQTETANIIDYDARPFDAVMTTSFLGNFTDEERPGVFEAWARLTKPGGRLLVTQVLNIPNGPSSRRFSEAEAERLAAFVSKEAEAFVGQIDKSVEELADMARLYARWFLSHAMPGEQYLLDLFTNAGFDFEHVDKVKDPERRESRELSGPSTNEVREHVRVIARRR